jgi:peptide/nickel transport system permease protein
VSQAAPPALLTSPVPASERRGRPWQRGWYRFRRNPSAVIGSAIVLAVVLTALLAPSIATHPSHVGNVVDFAARHQPPSASYLLGTDQVGRDVFSRVVFGYRISLTLVVVVLGASVPFGVVLGLLAGYYGGWVETLIMRLTDVFLAIPALVMALALTAALTPNLTNAMIAISALWWTWHTRLVYGIVRSLRTEEYVEAARLLGASPFHILFRELLPNLRLGDHRQGDARRRLRDPHRRRPVLPRPGGAAARARPRHHGQHRLALPADMWWQSVFPGLAILIAILGFNLLGDGLRDLFDSRWADEAHHASAGERHRDHFPGRGPAERRSCRGCIAAPTGARDPRSALSPSAASTAWPRSSKASTSGSAPASASAWWASRAAARA